MDYLYYFSVLQNILWSTPSLFFILFTSIYFTYILRAGHLRNLFQGLNIRSNSRIQQGHLSPFEALMTSLAGAVGTGTIVGITTGVMIGGYGAIFWMWITSILGSALKYCESLLSVHFRQTCPRGSIVGGPMLYLEKGVGWKRGAQCFAFFGTLAAIGTGNLVQVHAIGESLASMGWTHSSSVCLVLMAILSFLLWNGVKSIGRVSGILVPFMALVYITALVSILWVHADKIPLAFFTIVHDAFQSTSAIAGGFFGGSGLFVAIQMGVSRSIFSQEAGLGISSIATATSHGENPSQVALFNTAGSFLATTFLCTLTGLVLFVTDAHHVQDTQGAMLVMHAFGSTWPGSEIIVSISLCLFAFSTLMAWSYYGQVCFTYLAGHRYLRGYHLCYVFAIIPGLFASLQAVWIIADCCNALMVFPNLIGLILLSKVIQNKTDWLTHTTPPLPSKLSLFRNG